MITSAAMVHTATDLAHALRLRAALPDAAVLAGGTDLMVQIEAGQVSPPAVLNLWGCVGLRGVDVGDDGGARIGALTTWSDVANDARLAPVLRECARTVGARQIQNRGTVGGNICNASPAGDSLPVWLVTDATFELASVRGRRRVPAERFFLGYRSIDLAADELLVAVHLPPLDGAELYYRKVGTRLAQAISKVVLAARVDRDAQGVVRVARVALGAVAATPVRCLAVEAALEGQPVDPAAADAVSADIAPIDDVRSSAEYRGRVSRNLIRTWLKGLAPAR